MPAGNTAHADASDAPVRRSLRERDVSQLADPGVHHYFHDHPLTDTTTTTIGGLSVLDTAFRVGDTGAIHRDTTTASVVAPAHTSRDGEILPAKLSDRYHVFAVADHVETDELEALAVSIWGEAAWIGPGQLRLAGTATLEGPWRLTEELNEQLGFDADMTAAWVLHCGRSRTHPPSAQLIAHDEWAAAFPDGMPAGFEYKVLLALQRMARRLAGQIRISDTGKVFTPDPESAVNLTIFTSRWVPPEDLLEVLYSEFPTAVDSRDIPLAVDEDTGANPVLPSSVQRAIEQGDRELLQGVQRERQQAAGKPQVVDGYSLLFPAGNRSDGSVEVRRILRPPQVLRWASWEHGIIIEYALRWIPLGGLEQLGPASTRTARLERQRSAADLEKAAGLIHGVVGGHIVDQDGFLVGLEPDEDDS